MMTYMLACLKQQVKKYLAMTADYLKEIVPELSFVSEISVQRHLLMTLKLPGRSAAQKPLLTLKMKNKMLAFCEGLQNPD
jgi:hypothetical protein